MDTVQLTRLMKSDSVTNREFIGVFPSDYLNTSFEIKRYPSALIVNTDESTEPGQHWIAIYFDAGRSCEFFCSFGIPPQFYNKTWNDFISRWSIGPLRYNSCIVQRIDSLACGAHCCYVLYHRCNGVPFEDILGSYDLKNLRRNDDKVEKDMEEHLDTDIVIRRSDYAVRQICTERHNFCIR